MDLLEFTKVEGLGNDFLLFDLRARADLEGWIARLARAAPTLCDRRRGVGGDGLLLVTPPRSATATASMIVINHDGSRPEMCGNGLRCVAAQVAPVGARCTIDTDAGPLSCARVSDGHVEVDMGAAELLGVRTPAAAPSREFLAVSMGNPHAVAFVGEGEEPEALARTLGPGVERDPLFPHRTNVEFARVDGDVITLWVWERGCGITEACGTGACATAAAAVARGFVAADRELVVRLPGGPLQIRVPTRGGVIMRGPAHAVFLGRVVVA